ncbi:hypothetical protein P154DRAFT_571051 [Amniculicola lignicola CBS 123094]|uniref:Uncharacterized protein n=1 Tax=Amniculicola lignicola CBS 123094 TaxID=1392246 RepID=A0A6A5WZY4_9PLEO|nr:hypothetical protein P154DRAFT_571051 [Amniculicola lignicola CBS 123094]
MLVVNTIEAGGLYKRFSSNQRLQGQCCTRVANSVRINVLDAFLNDILRERPGIVLAAKTALTSMLPGYRRSAHGTGRIGGEYFEAFVHSEGSIIAEFSNKNILHFLLSLIAFDVVSALLWMRDNNSVATCIILIAPFTRRILTFVSNMPV